MGDKVLGLTLARIRREQGKRVVLLDALRGVCFVVMTIDHLPGNPVHRFSNTEYGFFGFFTGALGFVFLSGVVVGRVYDKDRVLNGMGSLCRRVLRRMRAIYFTQILMCVLVVAAVELHLRGAARWQLDLVRDAPWKGIVLSATLLYEPDHFGLLPMYLLFLLLTPIVLRQFGKGNVAPVLAVSAAIWLASGLMVRLPQHRSGVDFGAFNPIGYQFLFVVGLAFGANQLNIERLRPVVRKWLIGSSVVLATAFFALRLQYAWGGPLDGLVDDASSLYSELQLGPLRLLNFAAFGFVLYWICRNVSWNDVDLRAFRWLAFLGRHSLPVFAWSILMTYALIALFPPTPSRTLGVITIVLATASLTIPAQLRAMISRRQRKQRRSLGRTPLSGPPHRQHCPAGGGGAGGDVTLSV